MKNDNDKITVGGDHNVYSQRGGKVIDKRKIVYNYGPNQAELEKLCKDMAEQLLGELPVKISQETRAIVGEIVGHKVDAVLLRLEKEAESEEVFRKSVSRNFDDLRKDMQAFKAELKEQFDALYDEDSDELENLERLSRDAAHQADQAFGKIIKTLSAMKDIAQEFKETIRLDYTFELLQGWVNIREGRFDTAKEFFEKASRQMANEAEAYFGMYLADCKIQVLWDCVNCRWQPIFHDTVALDTKLDNNPYCNKAMQVANIGQKTEYEAFNDEIRYIKEEFEKLEDDGVDYDCFICVKVSDKDEKFTEDSKDAEGIYQLLSNPTNGFKPFYSKCTLKNTTGKNDEAHILYALYKAKCLIVVCSNREYLKTPWVKNEYTRYIDMMNAGDKSRDSIFIASCGTTIKSHQLGMSRSIQSRKYDRTNLQDNFNLGKEIVDFVGKFVKNNTGVGIENNSDAERTAREAAEAKIKEAEAKVRELEKKLEEERNAREENARKVREETEHQAREKGAQAKLRKFEGDVKPERQVSDEKIKVEALPADYPTLQTYNKGEFEIEGTLLKKYKGEGEEVKIPYGVTSIGYNAFKGCESLTSIIIPNSVTSIGIGAFEECTALRSITIPNSIKSIDVGVFRKCKMLTSIAIPNSVTSIEKNPFENCEALESITVEEGNPNYKAEGNCLIKKKTGKLLAGCKSSVIPNSVTSIGDAAFYGCKGLTSIVIPSSVTSIGYAAFSGCEGLTSIIIPNSATSIGDAAFSLCKGLTSIIIPNSVTGIGKNPFKNCEALESITVEEENPEYKAEGDCLIEKKTGKLIAGCKSSIILSGVTSIGEEAFSGCAGLMSIIIPNGVTSIGRGAFYGCMWLKSIAIPTSVTRIGGRAFDICIRLKTVYYEGTSEQWNQISISDNNDKLKNAKRYYNVTAEQADVIKARENQAAAESASKKEEESKTERKDSDEKAKSEALPADYPTLQNYNKGEFEIEGTLLKKYKGRGKEVKIPYGVTSIGYSAFYERKMLTSIIIPNSVTSIEGSAFSCCTGLTSIVIPNSVTSIGKNPFSDCTALESIAVEDGNPEYKAEGNCLIEKKTGKLLAGCKSSVIPNGVTSIGDWAFWGCEGLTSITIPNSVTSIGGAAFSFCTGLTRIVIPNGVTSIGGSAFYGCEGLTSVTIPNSVTSIEKNPFENSEALESITVEEGNPNYKAEGNCLIEKKTGKLLAGCKASVIPNSVTSIGEDAFSGCEGLTSIVIPNSVTSIGGHAFSWCTGLTRIVIPNSVHSIEARAFYYCRNLHTVYYEGTREQWNKIEISDENDDLICATRYYYSERRKLFGKYWHWDERTHTPKVW